MPKKDALKIQMILNKVCQMKKKLREGEKKIG